MNNVIIGCNVGDKKKRGQKCNGQKSSMYETSCCHTILSQETAVDHQLQEI